MSRRAALFGAVAAGLVVAVGIYLLSALSQRPAAVVGAGVQIEAVAPEQSFLAFRQTELSDAYGTVGSVPLGDTAAAPQQTGLSCERVDASVAGGICLRLAGALTPTAEVLLLNPDFTTRHVLTTPGIPSRAKVSARGRWAATTTFVAGHSYAGGAFSTQTEIYDMDSGKSLGNLQDWDIVYRGRPLETVDTNVWGVTFTPDERAFFATVKTGDKTLLARGDLKSRSMKASEVVAECPSLSPSGERVAFKTMSGPGRWRVTVRSLADGSETSVDEPASVDDQIEWLDEEHVIYGLDRGDGSAATDVWVARADGTARSQVLIRGAWSPSVVRIP